MWACQERSTAIRDAFRDSVRQLVDVVEQVPPEDWEKPGLGEWTVRELVTHVMRGVESPVVYSGQPKAVDMDGAATYHLRAISSLRSMGKVAERARQRASWTIAEAVGVRVEPPSSALNASPALLGEIAVSHGDGAMLAMALTGREALPEGFNVLG